MKKQKGIMGWLKERVQAVADNLVANLLVVLLGAITTVAIFWVQEGISWQLILIVSISVVLLGILIFFIIRIRLWSKRTQDNKIIQRLHSTPSPAEFIGREEEIGILHQIIKGSLRRRVISVYGPPGIGKSWLLNRFAYESFKNNIKWAKIDFRSRSYEPLYLLDEIHQQLGHDYFQQFQEAFDAYIRTMQQDAQQSTPQEAERREILNNREQEAVRAFLKDFHQLITKEDVILLFDTFENVEDSRTSSWLEGTLHPLVFNVGEHRCVMVVGGWNRLRWHNGWASKISDAELHYFTVDEVKKRLEIESTISEIDQQVVNAIHDYTGGHPLAVGLAATLLQEAVKRGEKVTIALFESGRGKLEDKLITEFLTERILERLDTTMARLVRCCSIPRWFDAGMVRAFVNNSNDSEELFTQLIGFRAFVQPHSPVGYEYHEIVRRLLLSQWKRDDSEGYFKLNRMILSYLEARRPDTTGVLRDALTLDAIYHAFNVNETLGINTFRQYFREALDSYRLDFCEVLLQEVRTFSPQLLGHVLEIKYHEAKVMLARELWQAAQNTLESLTSDLSAVTKEDQDSSLGARVYFELGNLAARRSDNRKAVELFNTSLGFLQLGVQDSELEPADVLIELGLAYIVIGHMGEAERSLREAERLMSEVGKSTSRLLLHKEVLYLAQGRWQDVVEVHDRFEELPRTYRNELDRLRESYHVAEATMKLGRLEDAMIMFEKNYDLAKQLRNPYRQVFAQLGLARVLEEQNRWNDALEQFDRAIDLLSELGGHLVALSYRGDQGRVLYKAGRLSAARSQLTESLKAARELEHEYEVREMSIYLGLIDAIEGNWQQAYQQISESAEVFRRLGHTHQEGIALVYLLEISYDKMSTDDFTSIYSYTDSLVRNRDYNNLLAKLYCIMGEYILQSSQFQNISAACQAYADACKTAIAHNRYTLDTTVKKIASRLNQLMENEYRSEALNICDGLIRYWKESGLELEEIRVRNREPGDGSQQITLLDQLQQERLRLLAMQTRT